MSQYRYHHTMFKPITGKATWEVRAYNMSFIWATVWILQSSYGNYGDIFNSQTLDLNAKI